MLNQGVSHLDSGTEESGLPTHLPRASLTTGNVTSIPDTFEVNCSTSKLSSSNDLSDLVQKIDLNPTLEQVQRFATSTRGFCTQSESGNVFFVFCLEWEEVEKYVNRVFFPGIKPSVSRKARDGKNEITSQLLLAVLL